MEYKINDSFKIINENSMVALDQLKENSVDAIVTDPPYELGFMGKKWDGTGIAYSIDFWSKCLRVLKPGGYLLSFGATRNYHRMACAIEDSGFELRDCIMWLYGSGFPKSHNVGLDIDKKLGIESQIIGRTKGAGSTGINTSGNQTFIAKNQYSDGTHDIKQAQNKYAGYGTCLKPAYEPIIMARKPLIGSVADNVLEYGTGAINIDECRIDNENGRFPANVITDGSDEVAMGMPNTKGNDNIRHNKNNNKKYNCFSNFKDCETRGYNDSGSASRYFYSAKASKKDRDEGLENFECGESHNKGNGLDRICEYCGTPQLNQHHKENCPVLSGEKKPSWVAKPKKNIHPTVKPTELMQYLVRLVSPKGATILDPFNGSGSTGKAVAFENRERNANYKYIGIEREKEYVDISIARIDYAINKFEYDVKAEIKEKKQEGQMSLFDIDTEE